MAPGLQTFGGLMISAILLASAASALERVARMPPQTRRELSQALERFNRLPAGEQQAIRALDEELDRLDPEERRRYLDLMRRFGAWVRRLDEETRIQLESASPDRRFELLRQNLGPHSTPESPGFDPTLWFRADTFNPLPLYDAVTLLRVWAMLDDAGRQQVESARTLDETISSLRLLGRDRGIEPAPAVREEFRAIFEEQGRIGSRAIRAMPDVADLNSWLLDAFDSPESRPQPGSPGPFPRRPGPPQGQGGQLPEAMRPTGARLNSVRLSWLRLAELEYVQGLRGRADGAGLSELASFEMRLPDWYRALLDPLPPDIVRLRLRGLRQLALADPEIQRWLSTVTPPSAPSPGGQSQPRSFRPF